MFLLFEFDHSSAAYKTPALSQNKNYDDINSLQVRQNQERFNQAGRQGLKRRFRQYNSSHVAPESCAGATAANRYSGFIHRSTESSYEIFPEVEE
jgi:hypothetical protein